MESPPPPSPQPQITAAVASVANSNLISHQHTKPHSTTTSTVIKKNMKSKTNRKDVRKSQTDVVSDPPQESIKSASSSSCCSTSKLSHLRSKGIRISTNRRDPRGFNGSVSKRSKVGETDALALPLGMSIAAFVAQVLERKDANGEKMSVDHLSEICTLAVKESLSNVFGNKFDCFVSNFERSFQSTLMTLRIINESSEIREKSYLHTEESSNNLAVDMKDNTSTSQEQKAIVDLDEENVPRDPIYNELIVHDPRNGQQLACIPPNRLYSGDNHNQSMLSTFEKSVSEQARSNDLKALEINLSLKKMRLKEAQIAVDCDSNILERFKLSMGVSKANFRAEKYKTELEESRHAQLLRKCADCLVAGLLIMVFCLIYGTYVYSHERLIEATESCIPIKESSSWWIPKPMASFSSAFQILRCQVQVISRMLFGILIIIAITYLLIQRSGTTNQTMPVTFILLLLGFGCGFAGKFCIDTLGGSGNHWLVYWEVLCLVHLFANIGTPMLFIILHGPIKVTDRSVSRTSLQYRFRRFVFYSAVLVCLPLLCGLIPFAGPGEWLEHFASLVVNRVSD